MLELNANDRCDACSAAALNRATYLGLPSELLFCNHHITMHGPKLMELGWALELNQDAHIPQEQPAYQ